MHLGWQKTVDLSPHLGTETLNELRMKGKSVLEPLHHETFFCIFFPHLSRCGISVVAQKTKFKGHAPPFCTRVDGLSCRVLLLSSEQLKAPFMDCHFPPEQEVVSCPVVCTHSEVTVGQSSVFFFFISQAYFNKAKVCVIFV